MPKVTVVQVIYNSRQYIERVYSAIFNQTFKDFNVAAVISGNDDGGKELLHEKFPQVEVIDPGYNIGFAKGHNLVFEKYDSEYFQLVNPDLILEPNYLENIIKAFEDPKVGAATGKLYKISNDKFQITKEEFDKQKGQFKILDSTGVTISKSGRARDRGQHEIDNGQYDTSVVVDAISGAGPMLRCEALESVKFHYDTSMYHSEYFDQDFHSYWEDVDLSWRMRNAGWKNVFAPSAVAYHGRTAGSSVGGYKDVAGFVRHHKKLPSRVRQLNYQNHIFMYIKNSPYFYPQFFVREFFMFFYILFFEISTLKILPNMIKLLPKMWLKRKLIKTSINRGRDLSEYRV